MVVMVVRDKDMAHACERYARDAELPNRSISRLNDVSLFTISTLAGCARFLLWNGPPCVPRVINVVFDADC
jgi:hypothetical protein